MKNSVYMTWAKHHAAARYNLANSGILGCEVPDLELAPDDLLLNGPNAEGYAPLMEAIGAQYGVAPECVVTAQGTSMANFLALATVLERGEEVLIEEPTYEPLLSALRYLGAEVRRFNRRFIDGYRIEPEEVRRLLTPRTRLIVLTSPHNPSGVAVDGETLDLIGEIAREAGARVLVDEVYRDVLFEQAEMVSARRGPQFMTTGSLTKSYGLSGLRCGWVLCAPDLAERMRRLNDLFGAVNAMPSDRLALAAFRQLDRLAARTRAILGPNQALVRDFLRDQADALEVVIPPRSMVVFPRLRHHADSLPLHDLLRRFETSIVPGQYFEAPAHFRLGFAVRTEEVGAGLRHLSTALEMLGGREAL
jgi:aspartate/methionine/tyrosine aminotransferase